jgi:hypothetical protein
MYDELFKACYGDDVTIIAPDELAANKPAITAGTACIAGDSFRTAIRSLGLESAGNCKYGAKMANFYKTKGVCEYPEDFSAVSERNGPYLMYQDTRSNIGKLGQTSTFDVFTTDSDGEAWLIILAVLWGVVVAKQTFSTFGFVFGTDLFLFFNCADETDEYNIAGGYAGAL